MNIKRKILGMCALLALVAGCRWRRTELVIGILTNIQSVKPLARVDLVVRRNGVAVLTPSMNQKEAPGGVLRDLGSYGVFSDERPPPRLEIELIGRTTTDDNGPVLLTQVRKLSLVEEQTRYLRMELLESCIGVVCGHDQTCDDGRCVPQEVADPPEFIEGADIAAPSPTPWDMSMPDLAKSPPDLATSPPDLAKSPPDLAMSPPDLAKLDLAMMAKPDLAMSPPDLAKSPPDLAMSPLDQAMMPKPDLPMPSCNDGVKNGMETDVDCGGPCTPCTYGMTWGVRQDVMLPPGYVFVGCGGAPGGNCNPSMGDAACTTPLPVLCLKTDGSPRPPGLPVPPCVGCAMPPIYYAGWAEGEVKLAPPIVGKTFRSQADADAYCARTFGVGFRIGEFHDGHTDMDGQSGAPLGGWNFYARGTLVATTRFWTAINTTQGNCWDH